MKKSTHLPTTKEERETMRELVALVPGSCLPNVHALRLLDDVDALSAEVERLRGQCLSARVVVSLLGRLRDEAKTDEHHARIRQAGAASLHVFRLERQSRHQRSSRRRSAWSRPSPRPLPRSRQTCSTSARPMVPTASARFSADSTDPPVRSASSKVTRVHVRPRHDDGSSEPRVNWSEVPHALRTSRRPWE